MTGAHSVSSKKADAALSAATVSPSPAEKAKAPATVSPPGTMARQRVPPLEMRREDIRKVIPKELFVRSTLHSLAYVAYDLAMVAVLGYLATWISSAPLALQFILWPAYVFCQGCVMTGLWVLAHECGHRSFSDSEAVCNVVGSVIHSALLVPFWSWKFSHAWHHENTCSMEHDEVFVPSEREDFASSLSDDVPIASAFATAAKIFTTLVFGWPAYLAVNAAGPKKYEAAAKAGKSVSHFSPGSALFSRESHTKAFTNGDEPATSGLYTGGEGAYVVYSAVGLLVAVGLIAGACYRWGPLAVFAYYGAPYLVVNSWLVLITYLQHTSLAIPHYRESEFTTIRGALATVDRSFGAILDFTLHHIHDTHVVHHLFSTMPFYNAIEATRIVKEKLGPYYLYDPTPMPIALWNAMRDCKYVDKDAGKGAPEGILYYRTLDDFARSKEAAAGAEGASTIKAAAGAKAKSN